MIRQTVRCLRSSERAAYQAQGRAGGPISLKRFALPPLPRAAESRELGPLGTPDLHGLEQPARCREGRISEVKVEGLLSSSTPLRFC